MIVAPGFIDPHTHAGDWLASPDPKTRLIPAFLLQGVTTAFIGNDGGGSTDVAGGAGEPEGQAGRDQLRDLCRVRRDPRPGDRRRQPRADAGRTRPRKGAGREGHVRGRDRAFDRAVLRAAELFQDRRGDRAVAPRRRKRGGYYDSHIRDESSYTVGLAAAIDEAIAIGRATGMPIHISHIKALGVDVQGMAPAIIAKIEAARAAGVNITASQYPWSASGTSLVASAGAALGAGRRDARR